MTTARFRLFLPRENMFGNLIWHNPTNQQEAEEIYDLFRRVQATGIWCSCFPEGDGFCFAPDSKGQLDVSDMTPDYYRKTVNFFKQVFGEDLQCETPYL